MRGIWRNALLTFGLLAAGICSAQANEADRLVASPPTRAGFERLLELARGVGPDKISALRSVAAYGLSLNYKDKSPQGALLAERVANVLNATIAGSDGDSARAALMGFLCLPLKANVPDPLRPYDEWGCGTGESSPYSEGLGEATRHLLQTGRFDVILGNANFEDFYALGSVLMYSQPDVVKHVARHWCKDTQPVRAMLAQELLVKCGAGTDDLPLIGSLLESRVPNVYLWLKRQIWASRLPTPLLPFSQRPFAYRVVMPGESVEVCRAAFLDPDPDIAGLALACYTPKSEELTRAIPTLVRSKLAGEMRGVDDSYLDAFARQRGQMTPEFARALLMRWRYSPRFATATARFLPILEQAQRPMELSRLGDSYRRDPELGEPYFRCKNDFVRRAFVKATIDDVRYRKDPALPEAFVMRILNDPSKEVRWCLGEIVFSLPTKLQDVVTRRLTTEGWRPPK